MDILKDINLWVSVIFFLLSLIGAVVLFKFLKSSAIIENEKYKAGGAIAGFVILFTSLTGFYTYNNKTSVNINKLQEENKLLLEKSKESSIKGVFKPRTEDIEDNQIVLAVDDTHPDSDGKFELAAKCIDPRANKAIVLYVFSQNGKKIKKFINAEDIGKEIEIPTIKK